MDSRKTETLQQIFHFAEHNIEAICTTLENGMYSCVSILCYQNVINININIVKYNIIMINH